MTAELQPAPNTIIIDQREGLWRMRVYPDQVQLFRSREQAGVRAGIRKLTDSSVDSDRARVRTPMVAFRKWLDAPDKWKFGAILQATTTCHAEGATCTRIP